MANYQRGTVIDADRLKISHADYEELEPAEARRKIKQILDQTNFGISPELVNAERAGKQVEGAIPARVPGKAILHGVTWVMGSNDGSGNNYRIEYGKPVAFDMVSGKYVTGVNPDWGPGEFKVVGTALGELLLGLDRIPVSLGTQSNENFAVLARCRNNPDEEGSEFPSIQTWSEAETATDQNILWDFELPKSFQFDPESEENAVEWEGSGLFVKATNISRMYVYKEALVLLHSAGKPSLQFYCDFQMGSKLFGTLTEDLRKDENALMKIDSDFSGGLESAEGGEKKVKVYDKLLDTSKKLKKDTKVFVDLMHCATGDDLEGSFTWKFYVTQANKCPVKDGGSESTS